MRRSMLGLIVCLLLASPLRAQEGDLGDRDAEIGRLFDAIQALEKRVGALEDENALLRTAVQDLDELVAKMRSPEGVRGPDITAKVEGAPTFRLEEVRKYDTASEEKRLVAIDKEVAALEKSSATATVQLDTYRRKHQSAEVTRLTTVIATNDRKIYKLKVEAARLNREIAVPRFWLLGWDGECDVMVLTSRDESTLMRVVRQDDFLQWTGDIVDAGLIGSDGKAYKTVVAKRVWRMEGEAEVPERPKGRDPVWAPLIETSSNPKSTPLPHLPVGVKK